MVKSPYLDKDATGSSHRVIGGWINNLSRGRRVLDVGTATGTIGRLLAGSELALDGLEPQPEWAALAKPYYRSLIQSPVEEVLERQPEALAGYEVVILADVLEHMVDPVKVLRQLSALQENGAVFMISLPNVANVWVRLNLMLGRFEYQERGILDRTHLHFYTRRTARALIEGAGLKVEAVEATPIPLELVHAFFRESGLGRLAGRMLWGATRLFPTLLGYQFVFRARVEARDK